MKNKEYLVTISNKKTKIDGYFCGTNFDGTDFKIWFNPLTVLGDLLDTAIVYDEVSEFIVENYSFKKGYQKHPFFKDKDCQREIETYRNWQKTKEYIPVGAPFFYMHGILCSFLVAVGKLDEIFKSERKENISLNELEMIRSFNEELKFTFKLQRRTTASEYVDIFFGTHTTMEIIQNVLNDKNGHIRVAYTCYSLEDILFAVWHYLVLQGYIKFNQCHHCERYFATTTLKQKYCNRKSPYKDCKKQTCDKAVDKMKLKLTRRANGVYSHLLDFYHEEVYNEFKSEYKKLKAKRWNVENLKELERFLDKNVVKERWYKPEYRSDSGAEHLR